MNPFSNLYDICNTGPAYEKWQQVADYPIIIDIEATNACNFSCVFCPTGNHAMKRPTGLMRASTIYQILKGCKRALDAGHQIGVRFIGWGEPAMNHQLPTFIKTFADAGVLTHLNTNGSMIDRQGPKSRDLIKAGLHSIKFSMQGVDVASFAEARQTDFFEEMIQTVKAFRRERDRQDIMGRKPWIQVSTTTTDESEERIKDFLDTFEPLCDEISTGKTIFGFFDERNTRMTERESTAYHRMIKVAAGPDELQHPNPCPEVYDKLTISWDGTVRVCCNDYNGNTDLGNINEVKLETIWQHPTIKSYRARLAKADYSGPLCSVCYDYKDLTNGESNERPEN
jgi:MoaA/NifB/PqqE/SkfB family radical SAM enzyme